MKKVLFMPLLTISSGHHHVADTLKRELEGTFTSEKVELLSYVYGKGEMAVSQAYLGWIKTGPSLYSSVYKRLAKSDKDKNISHRFYQKLFMKSIRQILVHHQPDLIICTHALPSYLLNQLKLSGEIKVPIINVYTDFVINNLWGRESVDLHLVPDSEFKDELLEKGVEEENIVISGIPVDRNITPTPIRRHEPKSHHRILVSGGNLGAGPLFDFIRDISCTGKVHYSVLCGKNYRLLSQIKSLDAKYISAYPYIDSKAEMNDLYEQSDAIITKPGGVTLSECLMKRLPMFIYDCLPGQEEYNLNFIKRHQLGEAIRSDEDIEEQILTKLADPIYYTNFQNQIQNYKQRIECVDFSKRFTSLLNNT